MSEAVTFWQGIARLPEPAQQSFWDAGADLSRHIGEPAIPRRLAYDTSRPPPGMPWWEKLLFYVGQGQYNRAVSNVHSAEATVEGAKWLWGALQGDFNKNPTTGQVIVGGIISMIPLVDQACDVRDVIANCIVLSDERARQDNENWIALGLTCIGFVPEFGSAIKTVAKVAIKKGSALLDVLKQMEWLERNFRRLRAGLPWGYAPINWLRNFDWQNAAREAATHAKRAFENARAKAAAAARYAIGAMQARLNQLAALFRQIADRITDALTKVAQRIKARVDDILRRERVDAGNYSATSGATANRHTQDEMQPPRNGNGRRDRDGDRDCRLRKYRQGCAGGKTPHHVVPDRVFKMPSGEYFAGGIPHADGYTICVQGGTPIRRGPTANEHGSIHAAYDPAERALGALGDPPGTATLAEIEAIAVATSAAITGCNPITMAAALRAYHQSRGLSPGMRFRADPTGALIRRADTSTLGSGATPTGAGGI